MFKNKIKLKTRVWMAGKKQGCLSNPM